MSKSFSNEISRLNDTYQWAAQAPIGQLSEFVQASSNTPLLAVGSGGSLTAAHFAALLHQRSGYVGKAITPLELSYSRDTIRQAAVLLLTAGGGNPDILAALKVAAEAEPMQLMAL